MKKQVKMTIAQFLDEHSKLIKTLKKGDRKELEEEAKEQEEEVKKEMKRKK